MRSSPLAACAAALAILTSGCGGAGAHGPGAADGAASIVPATATAFVAASTDLSSSRWHGLGDTLLERLPGAGKGLAAAAGGELDVAILPGGKAVALVRTGDEAALAAYARRHGAELRAFGDWTAVAPDTATLDTVSKATSHLSDNALFVEAMSRLPDGALVRVYASGAEALRLFAAIPGQLESRLIPSGARFRLQRSRPGLRAAVGVGTQEFRWLAASLTSTGAGLRLDAIAADGGLVASQPPHLAIKPIAPYAATLVDEIPAGATAVVDVQVPQGAFELLPLLPASLTKALGADAIGLPNELDTLLGGETAVYVRPGLPLPELTLVTQPADTAAASAALDALLKLRPTQGPLAGLPLYRKALGGQLVVSTTRQGIDAFAAGGAKLSSDPRFLEAEKQAGMPDRTTGFVYVDGAAAGPILALAGVTLPAGLPGLRAFLAYGAQTSTGSTLTAFLALR